MSTVIRKAVADDAAALLVLNQKFNGVSRITQQQIARSLDSNDGELVFVAEQDGTVIGFCCVQIFRSFCYEVDYAEITELYVDDAHQRQGVGTLLLEHAEQHLAERGIRHLQLFTGGENASAQAFYQKNGWSRTSEIMYRKRG